MWRLKKKKVGKGNENNTAKNCSQSMNSGGKGGTEGRTPEGKGGEEIKFHRKMPVV